MGLVNDLNKADPKVNCTLLTAHFVFNVERRQLTSLYIYGIGDRLDELDAEIAKHPKWTDAQIVEALKSAGAKFGPADRAEFLRSLPLKELELVTGRLEVVSADLGARYRPPVLSWRVEAKWHSDDGRQEADCLLFFEPFEGRLENFSFRSAMRPTP